MGKTRITKPSSRCFADLALSLTRSLVSIQVCHRVAVSISAFRISGDFAPGDVIQDLNRLLKFRDDAQRNSLALRTLAVFASLSVF